MTTKLGGHYILSNNISYKIDSTNGDLTTAMTNAGFSVDNGGNVKGPSNLNEDAIAAIAAYAKDDIGTVTLTGPGASKTVSVDDYGYYYITTTTGTLVNITSTNPTATVKDKNNISHVDDKKATESNDTTLDAAGHNAIAQVGTTVNFEASVTIGTGSKNVKFHDTMSTGLKLVAGSVTVTGLNDNQYEILATPEGNDTITIKFADGIAADTKVTIKYKAKVTSDALSKDYANNTATITYGDNNNTTEDKEVKVYNAKISVTKTFNGTLNSGDSAKFVLQRTSDSKYYKIEAGVVSWVDTEAAATKLEFTESNQTKAFTGLKDGEYKLHESDVPEGFNAAADQTFTISGTDYTTTNLEKATSVINEAGTALPSTGGMGTTIFYVLGAALVIGAGVVLVTRRRLSR
jgi:fimbrial isopeptide formation D2 family protein/LPXTG-motif cell wall-anchored protein